MGRNSEELVITFVHVVIFICEERYCLIFVYCTEKNLLTNFQLRRPYRYLKGSNSAFCKKVVPMQVLKFSRYEYVKVKIKYVRISY